MADEQPVLSILMPVYNEAARLDGAIDSVDKAVKVPFELVIVDDGSNDGSTEIIRERAARHPWMVPVYRPRNGGKGAALRDGLGVAGGRLAVILDADLECDPADLEPMMAPILDGRAQVVYGERMFGGHSAHSYWYVVGNRFVTLCTNVLFNCYIRDLMTCFKMMDLELFRSLDLTSSGFEVEAEITAKLLTRRHRIFEVPISYAARQHSEGKKLHASDAFRVLGTLLRIRLTA